MEETLKAILTCVQEVAGNDFSEYKLTTIKRRLARRLAWRLAWRLA